MVMRIIAGFLEIVIFLLLAYLIMITSSLVRSLYSDTKYLINQKRKKEKQT